ncbi:spore cortex biosynthesis protein YabQ [Oscillospiraceae bacterium PP1C4]
MEITIAGQTWMFLMSIALGAVLGVCYDVFRILRVAVDHPPFAVVIEDVIFSIICAVATFLFMISVDSGQVRVFVLIGEGVGFMLYYCTVGVLIIGVSKWIIGIIRSIFTFLWRIFVMPILRLMSYFQELLSKNTHHFRLYLKNKVKNSNIHLKKGSHLLYNLQERLLRKKQKKNAERQVPLNS